MRSILIVNLSNYAYEKANIYIFINGNLRNQRIFATPTTTVTTTSAIAKACSSSPITATSTFAATFACCATSPAPATSCPFKIVSQKL